jgi:hypothetical protein
MKQNTLGNFEMFFLWYYGYLGTTVTFMAFDREHR